MPPVCCPETSVLPAHTVLPSTFTIGRENREPKLSLSFSVNIYLYIYICMYICMYIYKNLNISFVFLSSFTIGSLNRSFILLLSFVCFFLFFLNCNMFHRQASNGVAAFVLAVPPMLILFLLLLLLLLVVVVVVVIMVVVTVVPVGGVYLLTITLEG